ncbi:MAG: outer membrane beta-barrel protein [Candidatus Sericytochromatia bacterium]|nr:outer membrane beta-barrel protein [Candidatus Sericytochromatia bacterium]
MTDLPYTPPVAPSGWIEVQASTNLTSPDGLVNGYRVMDGRTGFSVANAVLDLPWERGTLRGRLALQTGLLPASYYGSEPMWRAGAGEGASDATLWRHLLEAWAGGHVAPRWAVEAGLFLSPLGPETVPVRGNWNWSRSNLFYALPYYHTGMRTTWQLTAGHDVVFWLTNGWNAATDGVPGLSPMLQWAWRPREGLEGSLLWAASQERPLGAPEGRPWRHLLDAHATWQLDRTWAMQGHVDVGSERGNTGLAQWQAAAVALKVTPTDRWDLSLRLDGFREEALAADTLLPGVIFWSVPWVRSVTATASWRAHRDWLWRLEARHDEAAGALYPGVGGARSPVQDTVTLGMVQGF